MAGFVEGPDYPSVYPQGAGPTDPAHTIGPKKVYRKPIGPNPQESVYEKPIGPDYPQVYDQPAGPSPNGRQEFLDKLKNKSTRDQYPWADESGPISDEAAQAAHSFASDIGQVLRKYGIQGGEALGKIAPLVTGLTKYVLGPAGLALTAYDVSQNPVAPGDEEDRAAAFKSGQTLPRGVMPSGRAQNQMDRQARADRDAMLTGSQEASGSPVQQDQDTSPVQASPQDQTSSLAFLTPNINRDRENDTTSIQASTPTQTALAPHQVGSDHFQTFKAAVNHVHGNRPDKSAPLSDEAIVAWNAKHNPDFQPQGSNTATFRDQQGNVSPSGLMFMGKNVYMPDPRQPDGYKMIYSGA